MATWPTVTDDDGTGTTGTILDLALFNSIRDYIGAAHQSVTYDSANFTGSGTLTWTVASGDQETFKYVEIGKTMIMSISLVTTSVSGTGSQLRVTVPNGRTINTGSYGVSTHSDNGTVETGFWIAPGGLTYVAFQRGLGAANWSAATNATSLYATCIFEIV